MADKRATSETPEKPREDAAPGSRRKKRVPPTIDLTVTEMPAEAAGPQQSEPPTASEPRAAQEPRSIPVQNVPPATYGSASRYIAGAAGAVTMTVILFGLWLTGLLPVRYEAAPGPTPQPAADSKAIDAFSQRVSKIEETISKVPASDPSVGERLTAAENTIKSLGIAFAALNKRSDDAVANAAQSRARADEAMTAVNDLRASIDATKRSTGGISDTDFETLQRRVAVLEQSAKAAREEIAKTSSGDSAVRQALSAAALRDAVVSGAPFAAELAQAKSLDAIDKEISVLEPFAASGIPSPAALAQELHDLLPAMVNLAGAQAPQGGFLERLQANAGKLVRIRPVDAPPGDDPSAVLSRIEIDVAKSDVAAVLADLGKLPNAIRAPAQGWISKAQAREAALKVARRYAADAARAIGSN
jgi:hypothetical protein